MLSVVMSVYKESETYLRKSIESILTQKFSDFEFIIINDNPESKELGDLLSYYGKKDDRIRLYSNDRNMGLVYSLNRAISLANGEYIVRMDADDISLENRLSIQYQKAVNESVDVLGAVFCYIDENGRIIDNGYCKHYSDKNILKVLKFRNCVPHPTWFVKRNVYKELGGYRDVDCCEDYDFLLRAISNNYKISMCSECLLYYRDNFSGITRSNHYRQIIVTSYLAKNRKSIDSITEEEIRLYEERNNVPIEREKFESGEKMLLDAIEARKKGLLYSSTVLLAKALVKSKFVRIHFLMMIKEKIVN